MIKSILSQLSQYLIHQQARRRKKVQKAIERQARKLRAEGIEVDFRALKADYISQRRGQIFNSSDSEDPIDVVGDADVDYHKNFHNDAFNLNPFSIANLLAT